MAKPDWRVEALDRLDAKLKAGDISQNAYDVKRNAILNEKPPQPWYVRVAIAVFALAIALIVLGVLARLLS